MKGKQKQLIFVMAMVLFTAIVFGVRAGNVKASEIIGGDILDSVSSFQRQTSEEKAIALVMADPRVIDYLENFPGWTAEAYQDEGDIWSVDVFDATGEWQGYAQVNIATGEILELDASPPPSPEEIQAGQTAVQSMVLADAEVLALLGDPERWEYSIEYDRFDDVWDMYFERGLDAWDVSVYQEDGKFYIDEIVDANKMEEAQARQWAKDQAIELAYGVEGVWDKLDGIDNWYTYVENQGGSVWSVSFTDDDKVLFFARVDVDKQKVLESE